MAKESENFTRNTTIYDIANMAGVSIATVSRVLNGSANVSSKSKAKVQSAIDLRGYIRLHATISDSELRRTPTGNCLLSGLTGSLCRHAWSA